MRAAFHVSSAFNGGWSPRAPPEPRAQVVAQESDPHR